jgi:hypothetical protein
MSTKSQIRELAQIGKLVRYGAMSAALLLAAGSATLLPALAHADPAGGTYGNAPAPGAEFLSDQRAWTAVDAASANTAPQNTATQRQARAHHKWRSRPAVFPTM